MDKNAQHLLNIKKRVEGIKNPKTTVPANRLNGGECTVLASSKSGNGCICLVRILSGDMNTGIQVKAYCQSSMLTPGSVVQWTRHLDGRIILIGGSSGGTSSTSTTATYLTVLPTGWGTTLS